jgi:cell division protein FtsQ
MTDRDQSPIDPANDVSDAVRRELSSSFSGRRAHHADDAAVVASAGVGGGRTVIVIDDDLSEPEVDERTRSGASRRTRVDPRLRERRIAVRRAQGRRRLRVVLAVTAVVATAIAVLAVLASPMFAVDDVGVEGAVYSAGAELDAILAEIEGSPVLLVDVSDAERRLEDLPWVLDARVTRRFPGSVLVEIVERRPMAHFRGNDGRFRVIDVEGAVIAVIDGLPIDYVEITGRGPDLAPGDEAGAAYRGAARLANALPPDLRRRLSSMAVAPSGEISLVLDGRGEPAQAPTPVTVIFGRPDDYQDKLVALVNELARHAPGEISTIDVSSGSPTVT